MKSKLILLAILPLLLSGCEAVRDCSLTYSIWQDVPSGNCGPAPESKLALYKKPPPNPDLMVVYDELVDRTGAVRRRAFLLRANEQRLQRGKRPAFVSPASAGSLESIPVHPIENVGYPGPHSNSLVSPVSDSPAIVPGQSQGEFWVNTRNDGSGFTLVSQGKELGDYDLPTYPDRVDRLQRVLLTPLALAGDISIFGVVIGAAAVVGLCQSHASFSL
jgi:hypothetical protein